MILLDIDPNVVKPGWTPLIITVALAAVIVLLYFSMRRQVGRINVAGSTPLTADDEAAVDEVLVDEPTDADSTDPGASEPSNAESDDSPDVSAPTGTTTSSTHSG